MGSHGNGAGDISTIGDGLATFRRSAGTATDGPALEITPQLAIRLEHILSMAED
ncbi:MAG: hypothetical protein ACI9P3_006889 [Bradyrhizobium sp.]|jgi:hypothetical protein